ncbi:MAG: hypothetical protein J4224_03735 [Candidatus Diapherotrites archaeon]|uniref:Uncharacterized protein n=1 Tax=Candidatus Iainarchaeum sp. TaxID=3101447 RepID=A0A7J4IX71_9ARCH|nr:MAG: hypothetical protein QT03_C0001G0918 [archaeon GW2011_AR10]MBS3059504.1 hypothetical protein [Candidatus Diapherotrites archaeon]HIH08387.1 hypothetical protein [Candidatus Diapherotrites archaeon]
MKRFLLIIAVLVLVIIVATGFFSRLQADPIAEFKAVEEKFGLSGEKIVPASAGELSDYKKELLELRARFRGQKDLDLLVSMKLDLVEMEQSLLEVQQEFSRVDRLNPDCSSEGRIAKIRDLIENAKAKAGLALNKRTLFLSDYGQQANQLESINWQGFEDTVNGVMLGAESIQTIINSYC